KMHLIPLNSASLQETIATESQGHLVVIMFSASWCQPCNRAKPLVNVMASCLSDVSFGVLVSDESPANEACAMSFDVNAFPTIILFLDGQEVWRQRGFNQLELINRIQQLRPQLDECVAALLENEPGLARSAANILLRIADNILAHPIEEKYRRLKVSSNTVSEKLLPVSGGIECLFAMGFTDDAGGSNNGEYFELAPGPLVRVAKIRNQLVRVVTDSRHLPSIYVNMIPALASPKATNHQLVFSLMSHLSGMPKYEDPGLQSRARECIPLTRLEEAARTQVRQQLSAGNSGGCQLTEAQVPAAERDALLCELTAWFKTEFFKWTTAPSAACAIRTASPAATPPACRLTKRSVATAPFGSNHTIVSGANVWNDFRATIIQRSCCKPGMVAAESGLIAFICCAARSTSIRASLMTSPTTCGWKFLASWSSAGCMLIRAKISSMPHWCTRAAGRSRLVLYSPCRMKNLLTCRGAIQRSTSSC
ncbi:hypothetical protein BOX15_Mlig004657g4, partial [Macrostomum lignano]